MNKSVLIFGAGIYQCSVIRAAKEAGFKTIAIDPDKNAPGKEIADIFIVVPPKDYEKTKQIALEYKVSGIISTQMENPLLLMARLAEELNFIFPSVEAIKRCRNKYLMKQVFMDAGIPCAKGILINKQQIITEKMLVEFGFPCILKPVDSTGSKGVFYIEKFDALLKYIDITRNFSSEGSVLIEEYLEGNEYSVEAITYKETTKIIAFTEKIITQYPNAVELGHIQPANLSDEQKKQVSDTVKSVIKAIGLDNAASHCEIKLTAHGPKILEIGGRLGGDFIGSYLTLTSTGVDMDQTVVNIATGGIPEMNIRNKQFGYVRYLELEEGKKVEKINPWQMTFKNNNLIFAHLFIREGDIIQPITDSTKRSGVVIVKGNTRDEVIENADKAIEELKSKIKFY